MQPLVTKRLIIREIISSDAPFIIKILNDPGFLKNIGDRNVRSLSDAENFIESRYIDSYQKNGFGMYLVELKESGIAIGQCGLIKRDSLPDIDIGFAFLESQTGKGYAVEAGLAVLTFAKEKLKLKRLIGFTLPHNFASQKVLQKIGLKKEGSFTWAQDGSENVLFSVNF
jgi:RimJ/RimL family protein N-acetyltransferase